MGGMVGMCGMAKWQLGESIVVERVRTRVVVGGGPWVMLCWRCSTSSSVVAAWIMASWTFWILLMSILYWLVRLTTAMV